MKVYSCTLSCKHSALTFNSRIWRFSTRVLTDSFTYFKGLRKSKGSPVLFLECYTSQVILHSCARKDRSTFYPPEQGSISPLKPSVERMKK